MTTKEYLIKRIIQLEKENEQLKAEINALIDGMDKGIYIGRPKFREWEVAKEELEKYL